MTSKPGFGFWLKTLLSRPRMWLSLLLAYPLSAVSLDMLASLLGSYSLYANGGRLTFLIGSLVIAFMSVIEARSEGFKQKLQTNWRKTQVNMMRAELRAKETSILKVRNRPTFQRDRLRRMQQAQREFFDELGRSDLTGDLGQNELADQAIRAFTRYYELLHKEQQIAGLLEKTNRTEIEIDIARLEKQADASSSEARNQYLRAAEFRKQELRSLERAEQLSALLQAHMDALESALASMRTRMINTTVWDAGVVGNAYSDLTQELLTLEKAFLEVTELENDPLLQLERQL